MLGIGLNYAQSIVDFWGFPENPGASDFRLNSFESNTVNWNRIKSWELSSVFGLNVSDNIESNLYLVSLSKRIEKHSIYARYTPGIQHDFIFKSGTNIIIDDEIEIEQELKTTLKFSERFGFGYAFNLSDDFTAGFSLRYFGQEFSEEKPDLNFSDTLNYITIETLSQKNNFWRGDIGVNYRVSEDLNFQIATSNLFVIQEESLNPDFDEYYLKTHKSAKLAVDLNILPQLGILLKAETDKSFLLGVNSNIPWSNSKLSFGISAFHDDLQDPFIAGILPSLNYSSEYISFTLSAVKYFSDREMTNTLSEFVDEGINNVLNNRYSNDKIFASVNIALSFIPDARVKFVDVEIKENIYPTLFEYYLDNPFAEGAIFNLSDEVVSVKPFCIIEDFNSDFVYSPSVNVPPGDTAFVRFYTIIPDLSGDFIKKGIYQTSFYLTSGSSEPDDEIKRPIFINDRNGWNGDVNTLRYFVKSDFQYSSAYAKTKLNENRDQLLNSDPVLENFVKTEILFDEFIGNMLYVADPRATSEQVQLPSETMNLKGGDCDDLSVAFSSILESIGIQTAFVDYRKGEVRHVNLLINTSLPPAKANMITANDKKYFIRKNTNGLEQVWIPLEITSLTDFKTAWNAGSEKFYNEALQDLGLSKQEVFIVDIY